MLGQKAPDRILPQWRLLDDIDDPFNKIDVAASTDVTEIDASGGSNRLFRYCHPSYFGSGSSPPPA